MAAAGHGRGLGPGDRLGPYRIEVLLGEGGMGQVFRAVREPDGETVAVKVMKAGFAPGSEHARRFVREAKLAATVEHRHLVSVLDAGEIDGRAYLVMRYVAGCSLAQRIRDDGALSLRDTVAVIGGLAAGLDALHRADMVHRDVKSSNVMLDEAGSAALVDFGLAKGKGSGYSVLTRPGQLLGTLDYLAPEVLRGAEPGPAADIYALGCVAYECLAGRTPFAGGGMFQVGMAHLDQIPTDPCAGRDDAPAGMGEFALRALAKEPGERPPTATAYATVLAAALRPATRSD